MKRRTFDLKIYWINVRISKKLYNLHFHLQVMKMGEVTTLLPETPSPPLPDPKLQNYFPANSKTPTQKMFTDGKTSKQPEELYTSRTGKHENLFNPTNPPRARNPSKRGRGRNHSSGEVDQLFSSS